MTVWQVAAGSDGRDYTEAFIRFGGAFVGQRFLPTMRKIKTGDLVILKRGMTEVYAVGEAVLRNDKVIGWDDKKWLNDFDGWKLSVYCNVDWHLPEKPIPTSGLTRATIQRVAQSHLIEIAERVVRDFPAIKSYDPEPDEVAPVHDNEILRFLVAEGLRPSLAEDLIDAFRRIRLLASYYYDERSWSDVREHETRTFLIVPLLLGLGWAEQQIKIELPTQNRKRIDIACFQQPYRRDEHNNPNNKDCAVIIESKDFKSGLDYAHGQAKSYAEEFPNCRAVVVSNGYCYKTYLRQNDGTFSDRPSAYLNLLDPRDRYPLDPQNVEGALSVLKQLLPQWWRHGE